SVISLGKDAVELPPEKREPPWTLLGHGVNGSELFFRQGDSLELPPLMGPGREVLREEDQPWRTRFGLRDLVIQRRRLPGTCPRKPRLDLVGVEMGAHEGSRAACVSFGSRQR